MLTVPSGDILVFTGFLDIIESRDELAFALGHEIAHLTQNHGVLQMRRNFRIQRTGTILGSFLINIVTTAVSTSIGSVMSNVPVGVWQPLHDMAVVGPVSGAMARLAGKVPEALVVYAMTAASHAYSRDQEFEADELGVAYMDRAGYNPAAALKVIETFEEIWHPQ